MSKIEAIRPEKLTGVTDTLAETGLVGLNGAHVTGRGAPKGRQGRWCKWRGL